MHCMVEHRQLQMNLILILNGLSKLNIFFNVDKTFDLMFWMTIMETMTLLEVVKLQLVHLWELKIKQLCLI
jgi:hypothetical protein